MEVGIPRHLTFHKIKGVIVATVEDAVDSILSGKNTLVLGPSGSGKTSLQSSNKVADKRSYLAYKGRSIANVSFVRLIFFEPLKSKFGACLFVL